MKTIVVATDFSAPAENAMLYAGQLADTLNASVLLFHA
jgi:nucleotide-binding universal stress UspA family protein